VGTSAAVWFRRDLRVHDHPALTAAVEAYERVVPVFVLDDALLRGRYRSDARARWMLGCLSVLDAALRERGSGLLVLHGRPEEALASLDVEAVLWTSDVSPYARARDRRVSAALRAADVEPRPHGGAYVVDVSEPKPQRVFSRFAREWRELPRRAVLPAPERVPGGAAPSGVPAAVSRGAGVPSAESLGLGRGVPSPVREPGESAARAAFDAWLADGLDHYAERQDGMARVGTSRLAPYLRWGCLSARECEERALARGGRGAEAWVRQLAWRDFHAHSLLHHPDNVRRPQDERFADLRFDDDDARFAAWAEGRTGFPLVDAGMRELAATGFMHNRVRLVCGSLLTKELHLDWRRGEEHFARLLLCGEPAQNNGNWQWIAGVGTDPAPYWRRMYNPAKHQERFDPEGEYVRRWVPELRAVPLERLAEPWRMPAAEQEAYGCVIGRDYPAPIVDRAAERERAAERYRAAVGD
jgi:deoxyribodipyrimidine photo-lyase